MAPSRGRTLSGILQRKLKLDQIAWRAVPLRGRNEMSRGLRTCGRRRTSWCEMTSPRQAASARIATASPAMPHPREMLRPSHLDVCVRFRVFVRSRRHMKKRRKRRNVLVLSAQYLPDKFSTTMLPKTREVGTKVVHSILGTARVSFSTLKRCVTGRPARQPVATTTSANLSYNVQLDDGTALEGAEVTRRRRARVLR